MIEILVAANLWLCTYTSNETPPHVFSVSHQEQTWAAGEAHDTCWRHCLKLGCDCTFKDCQRWSPGDK